MGQRNGGRGGGLPVALSWPAGGTHIAFGLLLELSTRDSAGDAAPEFFWAMRLSARMRASSTARAASSRPGRSHGFPAARGGLPVDKIAKTRFFHRSHVGNCAVFRRPGTRNAGFPRPSMKNGVVRRVRESAVASGRKVSYSDARPKFLAWHCVWQTPSYHTSLNFWTFYCPLAGWQWHNYDCEELL